MKRTNGNNYLDPDTKDTHDRKSWFARGSFLLDPVEDLKFVLSFNGGQNLGLAPQFQNRGVVDAGTRRNPLPNVKRTNGNNYLDPDTCTDYSGRFDTCSAADLEPGSGDPFNGDYSRGGKERLTVGGITLNTDWVHDAWTFHSVTNLDYADREVVVDFDASPSIQADAFISDESWQLFEDAQLVWDDGTGLRLTGGVQVFYEDLEAENNFWNTSSTNLEQEIQQTTLAVAAFAHLEYELTETLILAGGARVNHERKNFTISTAYNNFSEDTFNAALGEPLAGYENRRVLAEQVRPSGEIVLSYEPTDDIKFYSRFTRGYKGQHFNGNAVTEAQRIDPVAPEFVNSYEIGWSANFLDGMFAWTGAGFYYDYENQQVYSLENAPLGNSGIPVSVLINAEDSRLIGLESELTISWEGIRWYNAVGVIYSEYSDFRRVIEEVNVSLANPGVVSISYDIKNYSGNQLVNAPEFSLVGSLHYEWQLPGELGVLTPRFDYRYKSQVFYTPENDSQIGAEGRWLFDMRIDYVSTAGDVGVGFWVRNLTEEFYAVTAFDRKKNTGSIVYVISEPRTFGATASFKF